MTLTALAEASAVAHRGRKVMLFAGVSAFMGSLANIAFAGRPRHKTTASMAAWVVGATLTSAGAAGVTYWLATRQ